MNSNLHIINDTYLSIQDIIYPNTEYVLQLDEQHVAQLRHISPSAQLLYAKYSEKLLSILPNLDSLEIIQGYNEGCRLLQQNLSGYMAQNFKKEYVPIMISAIRSDQEHTAWIFLQVLADEIGISLASLFISALSSKFDSTREKALTIVRQLYIYEAIPIIQSLIKTSISNRFVEQAREVLSDLEKNIN